MIDKKVAARQYRHIAPPYSEIREESMAKEFDKMAGEYRDAIAPYIKMKVDLFNHTARSYTVFPNETKVTYDFDQKTKGTLQQIENAIKSITQYYEELADAQRIWFRINNNDT